MKKGIATLLIAGAAIASISITGFAGTWQQDQTGWYWEEDGAFPVSSWKWLDGNRDGIAECYYFNEQGYLLTNTTTPDGCQVDTEGRWIENNIIQTRSDNEHKNSIEIYEDAYKKTSSLNSYVCTLRDGVGDIWNSTCDYKVKNRNSADGTYIAEIYNADNPTIPSIQFYSDGYCYYRNMDMEDMNVKYEVFHEEEMNDIFKTNIGMVVDSKHLTDLKMLTTDSGEKKFTFRVKLEDEAEINFYIDLYRQAFPVNGVTGTAIVDSNGYIKEYEIIINIEIEEKNSNVWFCLKLENLGEDVDFTLPSTEGYRDLY